MDAGRSGGEYGVGGGGSGGRGMEMGTLRFPMAEVEVSLSGDEE